MKKFADLFESDINLSIYQKPLKRLGAHIIDCKDSFASLEYLIDYRAAEKHLKSLCVDSYLVKAKKIDLRADEDVAVALS